MSALVKKVLIANRGEIAVRIARACREMGIATVAVYSDCDRTALHVRYADEAYAIGPSPPRESYLSIDRIIDAAARAGRRRRASRLRVPRRERRLRRGRPRRRPDLHRSDARGDGADGQQDGRPHDRDGCGRVRGVPAPRQRSTERVPDEEIARVAEKIGYPLLVKAVAGGGGKGMRTVVDPADLQCGDPRGAVGSRHRIRRHRRLPRAAAVAAAARRGAAARRPARHRAAVRGARMLDPAASSESRRGDVRRRR